MTVGQIVAIGFALLLAVLIIRQRFSLRALLASDKLIGLDAEDLAEQGIGAAYSNLLPRLKQYVAEPAPLEEIVDSERGSYAIRCNGQEYQIYSGDDAHNGHESWARATYYLFKLVNDQLAGTDVRFYALYGGNDLAGVFLTPGQAKSEAAALPRKTDSPYIPELKAPWYGQPH